MCIIAYCDMTIQRFSSQLVSSSYATRAYLRTCICNIELNCATSKSETEFAIVLPSASAVVMAQVSCCKMFCGTPVIADQLESGTLEEEVSANTAKM